MCRYCRVYLADRVPIVSPRVQSSTKLLLPTPHTSISALAEVIRLHQPMLADLQVIGGAATTCLHGAFCHRTACRWRLVQGYKCLHICERTEDFAIRRIAVEPLRKARERCLDGKAPTTQQRAFRCLKNLVQTDGCNQHS